MEVRGWFHALAALPLRKEYLVAIGREAGWAPDLVWTLWIKEKSLSAVRNRTLAV
jgi:hypothetical protein